MKLIIEPEDKVTPLLAAISGAKKSVDIAIFRFDRKDIGNALKAAAAKGIKVTALIAHANRGGEKGLRNLELSFLAAGITVVRTADDLIRYHDKYIIIDRRTLYLLSFNFTHLDIDTSRGFGIVTRDVKAVQEALKLFEADCTRTPYIAGLDKVVVSPANSRKILGTFLKRAEKELLIYDPKISDKEMLRILQERAKAGVEIRITGKAQAGAKLNVQKLGNRRLHTRTIIRDRRRAFIGSQSLRSAELDQRRELGLIIHDAKIVKKLTEVFEADWVAKRSDQKSDKNLKVQDDARAAADDKQAAVVVNVLKKELDPLTVTVKKAVRKAVAHAGEEMLHDKGVKDTVKKVVKKVMKEAVKDAMQGPRD